MAVHPVDGDDPQEAGLVLRAARQAGLREPVYLDAGARAQQALGTHVYPTFVLVDRQGNVRYRHSGMMTGRGERRITEMIERLLAEK